ncbi:RecQ family ATP-dependent DNA helicase [Candidatus Poriferisocius sp.]|uniref:RecQ family ATP-dependent DNA helicase n=1 Tax=Candidatus Poriferisocius sp. TaxID=3101276 RepID=UPI003B0270E0
MAVSEYVVFDLEANADQAHPPQHEIIEIGAVLIRNGEEADRLQTLARPARQLRPQTQELTGITQEMVSDAPPLAEALRSFHRFAGNRPLIAHNGFGYDFTLLDASNLPIPDGQRLDSLELAHVVFPRAGKGISSNVDNGIPPKGRSLDELARHFFGDQPRCHHRALDDARLLHRVLMRLLDAMEEDTPMRCLQRWILNAGDHPWAAFLSPQSARTSLADVVPLPEPPQPRPPARPFRPDAVTEMFQAGGTLMGQAREPRKQQTEMAELIAHTLDQGGRRLIEAPTGTGKTLAYLTPAIAYGQAVQQPVVVAPHSKVLQDQVMITLEELQKDIGPFTYVLLKGMANYISLDSLDGELDTLAPANTAPDERDGISPSAPFSHSEILVLAILCGWVAQTRTGDWDDLRTGAIEKRIPELRRIRRLLSVAEAPGGPSSSPLDERDFFRRARDLLPHADVAVLNHALLVTWDDWLHHSRHLILDEAHNLEDAATDTLSAEVSQDDIADLCNSVWDPSSRSGMAAILARAARWPIGAEPLSAILRATEEVRSASAQFGPALVHYLRIRTGAGQEDSYPVSYRIKRGADTRHPDYEGPVLGTGGRLQNALIKLADAFNDVNLPEELAPGYRRPRLEARIGRLGTQARDTARIIGQVLWAIEPEEWIAIGGTHHTEHGWRWELKRAPVSVADHLRSLWDSLYTAVLTSATLRVGNSFGYILDTLGLGRAEPSALDSPFAWLSENHMVLRTDYLPAPRSRLMEEFKTSAASEIPRLLTLTGGRGLVLMAARSRMEFVRDHARPVLDNEQLPLLAQGDDTAPALVERMRVELASSLIALRSFWEGVDIPGEALSLLVIEKVPFDSPADPVVGARTELMERRGKDPFADYIVPKAAIRFAQGAGRLIRTEHDRGVTVILDNRLCRAVPYRDQILGTLPGPPRLERANHAEDTYQLIADHLGDVVFDEAMRQRLQALPSADPWSELDDLELSEADLADEAVIDQRLEQVRERFGFAQWRPGQRDTMLRFMRGDDVLAVLPTGSGKSVTFQIPALLSPGVTLVISPLVALMNDQAENLRARGVVKVAAIHSGVPQGEWREILRSANRGHYKLLYVSPERLWSQEFVSELSKTNVARIAVDEAHCISQWGHSFRPEYARIPEAIKRIAGQLRPPILAVTATATPRVQEEIADLLELDLQGKPIVLSPDRPEIRYYTEHCDNGRDRDLRVVQIVEAFRLQPAIVYVPTRRQAAAISNLLRSAGHNAFAYHGGMDHPQRQHIEDAFRHGEIDVVVATKAFGMGIDKPDIALIVHLEMPASIEEYVQETGRAARGAATGTGPDTGTAVLLTMPRDCSVHQIFIKSSAPHIEQVQRIWASLKAGIHAYDPEELAERGFDGDSESVSTALAVHYLQQAGAVRRLPDTAWQGRVSVLEDTERLIDELEQDDPALAQSARSILAFVGQQDSDGYHARTWAQGLARKPWKVVADLLELNKRDILGFSVWKHAWVLERVPDANPSWPGIEELAKDRRSLVEEKSRRAKHLAHASENCRRKGMLEYLGAEASEMCDRCDVCADLPRPWTDSYLTREGLLESLPVNIIISELVEDTDGARYSRRRIVRTLAGDGGGQYELPTHLANHPAFGRLAVLGSEGIEKAIDHLIMIGDLEEHQSQVEGTLYPYLVVPDQDHDSLEM